MIARSPVRNPIRPVVRSVLGMLGGRSLQSRAIAALTAAAGAEPWYLFDHRGSQYQWQSIAGTTPAVAGQLVGKVDPVAGTLSVAAAADNSTRPTLSASPAGITFDQIDDALLGASGGGGTTGGFYCCAFRPGTSGVAQVIWGDNSSNTGWRVTITAGDRLFIDAGNGAARVSAISVASLVAGTTYVLTGWYDGTNVNVQINAGAVATSAAVALTAGTSTFTIGKNNVAATIFLNGTLIGETYIRNGKPDAATRLLAQQLMAQWAGVSL